MSQRKMDLGATPRRVIWIIALLVAGLLLPACADMAVQPAYQRQEPPVRNFPAAAVPVSGAARVWTEEQATNASNPLSGEQAVQAGNSLYAVNCRMCHGDDGKGTGAIASFFPPKPTDLTSTQVQQKRDGQIFWAVTNGFGRMPSFRKALTDTERWQLVSYVRTLR
ncbi:MAG: c-type cytochrome [Chloroflexota bacterium]